MTAGRLSSCVIPEILNNLLGVPTSTQQPQLLIHIFLIQTCRKLRTICEIEPQLLSPFVRLFTLANSLPLCLLALLDIVGLEKPGVFLNAVEVIIHVYDGDAVHAISRFVMILLVVWPVSPVDAKRRGRRALCVVILARALLSRCDRLSRCISFIFSDVVSLVTF